MGQANVVRRFDAPAATLWGILSWTGMAQLAGDGLFAGVRFEGDTAEVGATKWLDLEGGVSIRERLEWLDEAGLGYGYRIIDSGQLPVADYVGAVRIVANGPAACTVLIQCRFVGVDVSDADWERDWSSNETAMLNRVAARLADGSLPAAPPPPETDDIAAIIRGRSDVFEADFAAGDAMGLVSRYYVETPRVIMPGMPMLTGREPITNMMKGMMEGYSACSLRQIEVRQSADMAYELSEATLAPRDPAAEPLSVRYVIIWTRTGGEWRVAIDFFGWGDLGLAPAGTS